VRTLITILAYNEEANIANTINKIRDILPDVSIAVINDGSIDDTELCARQAGVDVINLPFNLGIGGAMQTGLKLAISRGFDIIVRMDGDGQHPPENIPDLLAPVIRGEADIAVGTRFMGGGSGAREVSFPRRVGILFFSLLATWFSGRKVSDATCSFQAINRRAAIFLDKNMEQDHPEVDGWIMLGRAGFQVKEIPMVIHPRRAGVSSINSLRALYFLVKVSITAFAAHSRKIIK
jgi:glycosyltransferase involved in cell wall biosynthesis